MPTWLYSQIVDELAANLLLHMCLRYRRPPPLQGPTAAQAPNLYSGDMERFYAPGATPVDLHAHRTRVSESALNTVWDFRYPSENPLGWPESDQVWGRHWECRDRRSDLTVIGVHGIVQVGCSWFDWLASRLNPRGVDLVMMDSPFNYRRTPRGFRPGQLIVGGNLGHQLAVARQGVLDLWRLVLSLQQQGRRVGLVGVSYGGWLSCLTAVCASDLQFVSAVVPPIDLIDQIRHGGTLMRAVRAGLGTLPCSLEELEQIAKPILPRYWSPRLPGKSIRLYAAKYDRFVSWQNIETLARLWDTDFVLHNDGHYRITMTSELIDDLAEGILRQHL